MKEFQHDPNDPIHLKGRRVGLEWGRRAAQPAELEHVQRLFERLSNDPALNWDWYFFESQPRQRLAQQLAIDLLGVDPKAVDRAAEADAFWREVATRTGEPPILDSPVYLQGFADGALQAWDETRNKI